MLAKLDFQQVLLQSLLSHDTSEIMLICWFGAKYIYIYIYIYIVQKISMYVNLYLDIYLL